MKNKYSMLGIIILWLSLFIVMAFAIVGIRNIAQRLEERHQAQPELYQLLTEYTQD
jgi:hypothetical protein